MKKIIITTLSLVSLCFASEGAADYLASLVLGVFALIAIPVIVCFCGVVFEAIVDFFKKLWKKTNLLGKLVLFIIPLIAILGLIIQFIVCSVIPTIYDCFVEYTILSTIIVCLSFYISTIITGWCNFSGVIKKRNGIYSLFSRIFVTLPVLPIVVICWFIKNIFCKLFIKNYDMTNIFSIWTKTK